MTINEWIEQNNVRMDAVQIAARTDGHAWNIKSDLPMGFWRITLTFERGTVTFEWSQGPAHRAYRPLSHHVRTALDAAGIDMRNVHAGQPITWQNLTRIAKIGLLDVVSAPVSPKIAEVIDHLHSDMDVIHSTFEQWADSTGLDNDSIRAGIAYEATRDLMLSLLHAMGRDAWQAWEEITEDD